MIKESHMYYELYKFLLECNNKTITLTYHQIETIIGNKLPLTAHKRRQWWENETEPKRSQIKAWIYAGWKVDKVDFGNKVTFVKF